MQWLGFLLTLFIYYIDKYGLSQQNYVLHSTQIVGLVDLGAKQVLLPPLNEAIDRPF